jgi:hypothetical protein
MSIVSVDVGGQSVPYRSEPRCFVCRTPERLEIEEWLVVGRTSRMIMERWPDRRLSHRNLMDHVRLGHLPLEAPAVKQLVRERTADVERLFETAITHTAQRLSLAHLVVEQVRGRLDAGDLRPELKDGLAALRLILDYEKRDGPAETEEIASQMLDIYEAVKATLTPEQFQGLQSHVRERVRARREGRNDD